MAINEYDKLMGPGDPAAAGLTTGNEYDALMDQGREEQKQRLQGAMFVAAKAEPDRRAKALELAERHKLPVDLVERNFDMVAQKDAQTETDYDGLMDRNPRLAKWLEDPNNAAVSRDDFDNLSTFESYVKQVSTGWQKGNLEARSSELWAERLSEARAGGSYSTTHDAELSRLGKDLEPLHALDENVGKNFHPLYQFAAQIPNMTRTFAKFGAGEDFEIGTAGKGAIEGAGAGMAVGAGAGSLGLGAGAVPGAAIGAGIGARVGGIAGMAQYAYQLEAGSAFKEYSGLKDQSAAPIDMKSAADAAHTVGLINAGLETAGDLILMKVGAPIAKAAGGLSADMAVKALTKLKIPGSEKIVAALAENPEKFVGMSLGRAVREAGKLWTLGMVGEVSTEFVQEVSTGVGKEAAKSASGQTFSENSGLVQIAEDATGVIYPTMQAMMIPGGMGAGAHFYNSTKQMRQAEIAKDAYSKLGEIAEQSKLKARLPGAHEKFVDEAVKGTGVETIQILPEPFLAYFQSKGLDGVGVAEELGITEQLKEAVETGQKLVVPASVWMSKLGPTEHYKGLENDISFSPESQSVNEAKEIHDELGKELEAKATEAAPSPEVAAAEASFEESAAKVGESVSTQLKSAGVAPADADVQALIHQERSKVRADLLGETPEAVFNRHNLEIRRQDSAQADEQAMGQSFSQSSAELGPGSPQTTHARPVSVSIVQAARPASEQMPDRAITQKSLVSAFRTSKPVNGHTGWQIGIPAKGIKETLQSVKTDTEVVALEHIDKLIESAVYERTGPDAKSDKNVKAIHYFYAPLQVGDQVHAVRIMVRETNMGQKFYDGMVSESVKPAGHLVPVHSEELSSTPSVGPHTISISDFNALINSEREGFPLFQGAAADEARGRISFGKNKTIIDLFRSANLSTFLHEGGHLWLSEVGQDFAQLSNRDPSTLNPRQQRFLKDAQAILDYLGAESFESVTRDQHETFARSVEAYLMEGKAPSIALRKAFATFKVWLIDAYKKMAGLHVTLTPEIRGVMDRMLASEEEIAAVQREMKIEPLFTDPAKMGMSDKQTHAYLAAIFDAEESAKEDLNAKLMADYARAQSAMYKEERVHVREAVEKEVSALPVYVAIEKIKANKEVKLSRKALSDLGVDASKALPRGVVASKAEGGLHPDVAAPLLGYASGSELVSALTSAQDKDQLIDRQTDDRMAEQFPDLLTNGKLPEEALKAHHNQSRSKLLRLEMEHLLSDHLPVFKDSIRRVARRMPTDHQVREQAQAIISTKAVKDMRPSLYQRAEIRAAKAAGVALSKGDIEAAFLAKRSELLNHELFRAATQARETLEKSLEKFKKLSQSDDKLAKSRDMDLVNTARAILADIGIGKSEKPSSAYVEKIRRYDPDMFETVQALIEGVSGQDLHFSQMTFGDFMAVKDSVDALWGLSKSTRQIEISGQILDREEVIAELSAQVAQIVEPKAKAGYQKAVSNWDKAKIKLLSAAASLTRAEAFVEAADMGAHNGPFRKFIWNPVSEATTRYRLEKQALIKKYEGILKDWAKGLERKPIEAAEIGYTFRDKAELMMAVLHSGNDSNLDKLLRGRNWGEQNPEGVTDRSRFDRAISRLQSEGVLTKQDYDFAQSVWDLLDETKVEAQKAHKAIHGHYFNEITANEVVTPFGVYRGGYIPAKVDLYTTEDASIRSEREAFENNNNSFQFPTTGRGFTKSRTQAYAAPLSLEMSLLSGHLDGVLRFSYIEPTVRSVARITQDKGFRETLSQLDPTVGKELLTPWLQRAAQQKVVMPSDNGIGKAMDSVARYLRRSVAMQIMVGSVTNTLQQFTGVVVAASKVKPLHLRNALASYVSDIKGTTNAIMEKSEWMRSTQGSTIYESHQAIEKIILDPSTFEKIQDFSLRHTYFLQTAAQNIVNTIVWTGAYEQAIAAKLDEKSAVLQADAAVRLTQGSNNPEDVSRFETGTATARLFTQFAGYFNMLLNLNGAELAKISRDVGLKKGAGRAFYLYSTAFMIPAVLSGILVQIMGGKGLDEDDDGYLNDMLNVFFGSQVKTAFALVPYGGQALNASLNSFNGNRNDDRISLSPVVSFIETMTGVPAEVYKAMNGENASNKKVVKDVLTFIGTASSLPIGPIGKPVGYLMDVSEGKARPTGPVDAVRGLVTGKPGKAD